ncbi:exopolygalacturonase clone GBGE184 [Herrania umbratica]|uniref:Polygalacturonase n=1 Tax=Herrania umbratica TaxID=108875 RepID=A0A6J1A150_9ROSI|nr:exopolygalacturonase clone GBGE184 [Herrania umbratica]
MAIAGRCKVKTVVLLGLALLSCVAEGAVLEGNRDGFRVRRNLADADADADATVFDVMTYGAKADGKTDNFEPFVKAWKAACSASAPATLVIPRGTYLTGPVVFQGPCKSSNPIAVKIEGTIKATTDISEYPTAEWILFELIDGLIITGNGTIDGQGASVWGYNDCSHNSGCQLLPASIKFHRVNNSVVNGISSVNAKSFHMFITHSANITAHDLNITAPAKSPNTDGIHISSSSFVNITNSNIGTGDDCISIGQGATNISISGVFCGPGHGISIGSLGKYKDEKDVSGIVVKNCTLSNTTNGARIKTWPGSPPSQASSITFQDIVMDMVQNPIIIDQNYGSHKSAPSRVKVSHVHYKNIRGTSKSPVAVSLSCSSEVPCQGVQLVDIDLAYKSTRRSMQNSTLSASCLNVKVTSGGKQSPPACP